MEIGRMYFVPNLDLENFEIFMRSFIRKGTVQTRTKIFLTDDVDIYFSFGTVLYCKVAMRVKKKLLINACLALFFICR